MARKVQQLGLGSLDPRPQKEEAQPVDSWGVCVAGRGEGVGRRSWGRSDEDPDAGRTSALP